MKTPLVCAAIVLTSIGAGVLQGEARTAAGARAKEGKVMNEQATGTFEVKVKPLPGDEKVPGLKVGRLSIDKEWAGDIVGTSKGEMMTGETRVKGSGGYVAIEVMNVAVKGRQGTFTLMHHATMKNGGEFKMLISVIPDSGTGQLEGLSGALTIIMEAGTHSYRFDYSLPEAR